MFILHQLYGRRAAWEDPAKWVMESFPWAASPQQHECSPPPLLQLRPEDVGFDGYSLAREGCHNKQDAQGEAETDPLVRHSLLIPDFSKYISVYIYRYKTARQHCQTPPHKVSRSGRPESESSVLFFHTSS